MAETAPATIVEPRVLAERSRRECEVLTRWLVGSEPGEYVIACYERGLRSEAFREGLARTRADTVLDAFVRLGVPGAALADAWSRVFRPAGQLRRKQVLLLAILESVHPSDERFDAGEPGFAGALGRLVLAGCGFLLRLLVAVPVIGVAHALSLLLPVGRRSR